MATNTYDTKQQTNAAGTAGNGAGDETRATAERLADRSRHLATNLADTGKERLADQAEKMAQSLRHASECLNKDEFGAVCNYADEASHRVHDAAEYLRNSSCDRVLHDANRVARKHPELVVGAAALAGVAIARFLKASKPSPQHAQSDRYTGASGYDQGNWSGRPQTPATTRATPSSTGFAAGSSGSESVRAPESMRPAPSPSADARPGRMANRPDPARKLEHDAPSTTARLAQDDANREHHS